MATIVNVDIKSFTDAQQAKVLRALCRKDKTLRDKVAHMLQISYGNHVKLSAAATSRRMSTEKPSAAQLHFQDQYSQLHSALPSEIQLPLPDILSEHESDRRSGSASTVFSGISAEIPARIPTPTEEETSVFAALSLSKPLPDPPSAPSLSSLNRVSRSLWPYVPHQAHEKKHGSNLYRQLEHNQSRPSFSSSTFSFKHAGQATQLDRHVTQTHSINTSSQGSCSMYSPATARIATSHYQNTGNWHGEAETGSTSSEYISDNECVVTSRSGLVKANHQNYICTVCKQVFSNQKNTRHSCRYHPGKKVTYNYEIGKILKE